MAGIKVFLVGTPLGRLAGYARGTLELLDAAWKKPEQLGTLANDHLATFLAVRLCRPGGTFIDVGAHIGSVIAAMLHVDRSIPVIAIEAIPEKADKLRGKFPGIEVHCCAAGATEGDATFFVDTVRSGYSSLLEPDAAARALTRSIRVRVRTLDSLLIGKNVAVMKIDVEGAELDALKGSHGIIAQTRPVIMFESGPGRGEARVADDAKQALWHWLHERGFEVLVPNRVAHMGPGLSADGFLESHIYPRRSTNYFAVPSERRAEVRDRSRQALGIRS